MSATDCFAQKDENSDKNGACSQSGNDRNEIAEPTVDSPLHEMRKGLFGRSASYLQVDESDSQEKELKEVQANQNTLVDSDKEISVNISEQSSLDSSRDISVSGPKVGKQSSLADEIKEADKNAHIVEELVEKFDEKQEMEESGDAVQTQKSTVTSVTKTEVIFETSNVSMEYEESRVEIVHKESDDSTAAHADSQSAEKEDYVSNESDHDTNMSEEDALEVKSSEEVESKKLETDANDEETREKSTENENATECESNEIMPSDGNQLKLQTEQEEKADEDKGGEEDQPAVVSKSADGTRESEEASSPTRREIRRSKRNTGDEKADAEPEKLKPVTETDSGGGRRKSLRARKPDAETTIQSPTSGEKETEAGERRKSLRTPKVSSIKAAPTVTTPRKSPSSPKKTKKVSKSSSEERHATTSTRAERKSKGANVSKDQPVQRSSKKKKRVTRASESDKDPFSFDNFDNHPEPLRNIQMERQSFGGYKFTKSPVKSPSSYEKTEQTASAKLSNLPNLVSQHQSPPHKSLAELESSTPVRSSSKKKTKAAEGLFSDVMETDESSRILSDDSDKEAMKNKSRTKKKQTPLSKVTESKSASGRKRKMQETTPVVTPKRQAKPLVPDLDPLEQFEVDHRPSEHIPYSSGARVYALWDRLHYPARISADRDASGRYEVVFVEDGAVRRLVSTGIIPICALVPEKKCLTSNSSDEDEVFEEVKIIEMPSSSDNQSWTEGIFVVKSEEEENRTFNASWQKLVINLNQAKDLNLVSFNPVRDVNTENIDSVERRRTRAARHIASGTTPTGIKLPRSQGTSTKSAAAKRSVSEVTEDDSSSKKEGVSLKKNKMETDSVSSIFDEITFVVTSAVRKIKDDEQGGFSKREVRQLIEARGGTVVDDLSKSPEGTKMFLIADTYYRTHKYLSALARSIPCVSHQWIRECAKEDKLLDHDEFMLPAGVSLLNGETQPWHSKNGILLKDKTVFLFSLNRYNDSNMPNFKQIWSPLIIDMGAKVVGEMSTDVDVILTDTSCTKELLAEAKEANVPVVSSEWIIQSIIHGSLPDADAHERFKYDYVEKVD